MGNGLGKNNKVKNFTLQRIESITSSGWVALFQGMSNSNSSLKELNLSVNDEIDDEGALAFAAAIDKCKSIKSLELSNLHSISTNSWTVLLKSLFNPDSVLENLYMYNNNIDGGVVTFLGGALVNNSTLKSLSLISNGSITGQGWVAFFGCLSNLNSL